MSINAWNDICWPEVESRLNRLQRRIYKASLNGDKKRVHFLQKTVLRSIDAKLYSVKRVCQGNKGRKAAGVGRVTDLCAQEKLNLALGLKLTGNARPMRRVYSPKPGKTEKRPLGIPIIKDRALQQLVRIALEPEWEARFEANSY